MLLAVSVGIAVVGIANTLVLSVTERTREIGLLGAVGATARQLRVMVAVEAVSVAFLGTLSGVVVGTGLGIALAGAIPGSALSRVVVPVVQLVLLAGAAVVVGSLAAVWPARRAARLDPLAAIAATS